jgi:AcrR family transcriptional regulator
MNVPVDYVEEAFQLSSTAGNRRRADALRNRGLALEAASALLAEPGATLTVEAIAKKAGLGAATVVRAFGGKNALLDAAVADVLEPMVQRAKDLLAQTSPEQALRTFLAELIAFQSAHHGINHQLDDLDLPTVNALRADLARALEEMLAGAQRDGAIRTDLDPALTTAMVGQTAYAISRSQPASAQLVDTFITIIMDGLRPQSHTPVHRNPSGGP